MNSDEITQKTFSLALIHQNFARISKYSKSFLWNDINEKRIKQIICQKRPDKSQQKIWKLPTF